MHVNSGEDRRNECMQTRQHSDTIRHVESNPRHRTVGSDERHSDESHPAIKTSRGSSNHERHHHHRRRPCVDDIKGREVNNDEEDTGSVTGESSSSWDCCDIASTMTPSATPCSSIGSNSTVARQQFAYTTPKCGGSRDGDVAVRLDFSPSVSAARLSCTSGADEQRQRLSLRDRFVPPSRTLSTDRRLNEVAQFFHAVGEAPPMPASAADLQDLIEDDDENEDAYSDMSDAEEEVATCCNEAELDDDEGVDASGENSGGSVAIALQLSPRSIADHHQPVSKQLLPTNLASLPRRLSCPFFGQFLPGALERQSSHCSNNRQSSTFVYRGIQSNPPDITKVGMAQGNYAQLHRKAWLEVADSKHRYGKNLRLYYRHWESLGFPTNKFFDWLDSKGEAEGQPLPELEDCPRSVLDHDTVLYITDENVTKKYALSIDIDADGRGVVRDANNQPVQTGSDGWIFVLRDGVLYAAKKVTSIDNHNGNKEKHRFHHSTFFGGKAVAAAGILVTDEDGILTKVFPHSGHYRPGEADMQRMLYFLHEQIGIDLNTCQVDVQQLVHVNRQQSSSEKHAKKGQDRSSKDTSSSNPNKMKKKDTLHLQSAASVAHYLSHKARFINEGVFEQVQKVRAIDKKTVTNLNGLCSVRQLLELID